jgi:hypothetical protein
VEGTEQFADGLISQWAFAELSQDADRAYGEAFNSDRPGIEVVGLYAASFTAAENIEGWHIADIIRATADATGYRGGESPAQAALLREIFGNPFCSVKFNKAWRTSDVMLFANGIYAERAFDRMPILADALQDAGCGSADILDHLRDPHAKHVRGCWALDLVLGKE